MSLQLVRTFIIVEWLFFVDLCDIIEDVRAYANRLPPGKRPDWFGGSLFSVKRRPDRFVGID